MIIYLHGFASSGRSRKARQLQQWLAPVPVLAPSYSQDPEVAVAFLEDFIRNSRSGPRSQPLVLIGSSLGGYYAQYLGRRFSSGVVLINPALEPVATLAGQLGENRVYQTGEPFVFTRSQLLTLKRFDVTCPCDIPVPTLVLLDAGDEVVDPAVAAGKYAKCGEVRIFDGGDHGFAHLQESLGMIKGLYQRLAPPSRRP